MPSPICRAARIPASRGTLNAMTSLPVVRWRGIGKCEAFGPMQSFHRALQPATPHEFTIIPGGHTGSDNIPFPVYGTSHVRVPSKLTPTARI